MTGKRLRIRGKLYEQLARSAEAKGYSSAEEYALDILEKAVADALPEIAEQEVKKQLQGLGYIE